MFRLLEIKIEYRHLWMNTVNDLRYEIKFENRVKDKNNFLIKRNISFLFFFKKIFLFLETYFNCLGIFFVKADVKKYRPALAKASTFAEFRML